MKSFVSIFGGKGEITRNYANFFLTFQNHMQQGRESSWEGYNSGNVNVTMWECHSFGVSLWDGYNFWIWLEFWEGCNFGILQFLGGCSSDGKVIQIGKVTSLEVYT